VTLRVFYLFFNYFLNGHGLRGSILLSSGSFAPKFCEMKKNAVLMNFGVKNSNSTKIDLRGLWFGRRIPDEIRFSIEYESKSLMRILTNTKIFHRMEHTDVDII